MTAETEAETARSDIPSGVTEHDVMGDGISLHYAEYGTGHPIVWLHGSGPGATGLSNFGGNIASFGDFRNLLFDHPRWGQSDKPAFAEPMIHHSARNIIAALDTLGVSATHLVGNSFGGSVSLRIAAERPDLVRRVVVMGGGARKVGEETPPGMQILFRYMAMERPTREALREFIDAMLYDKSLLSDHMLDERLEASLAAHPEIALPANYGDLEPDLERVRAQTLLLWGREDAFGSLERALLNLRGIADAELRVIPRCGHWVQYEAREYFDAVVSRFFREGR
jgi:4,5:9,10-diseco-3-hydroxy-5,9,17-trioxoandrosta-1(10),2-diene-4-oate hydrolase